MLPANRKLRHRRIDGNQFFAQQRNAAKDLEKTIINTAAHLATDYSGVEVWVDGSNASMSPEWSLSHAVRKGIVFG